MPKKDKIIKNTKKELVDRVPGVRRVCPILIIIDTSGSMDGAPIGAVNSALNRIIPEFISMNKENANYEIKVALMEFCDYVKWLTTGLVDPETVELVDLQASGDTKLGKAFLELEKVLHVDKDRGGFMYEVTGSVAPIIVLLSDGEPTDDYLTGLMKLKEVGWFNVAGRVALGYGNCNDAVLEDFTGCRDSVLHTNTPESLMELIKFVTITPSQVVTKGKKPLKQIDPENPEDEKEDENDTTNNIAAALKVASPQLAPVDPDDEF